MLQLRHGFSKAILIAWSSILLQGVCVCVWNQRELFDTLMGRCIRNMALLDQSFNNTLGYISLNNFTSQHQTCIQLIIIFELKTMCV